MVRLALRAVPNVKRASCRESADAANIERCRRVRRELVDELLVDDGACGRCFALLAARTRCLMHLEELVKVKGVGEMRNLPA